jgi:hypothetical protein
LPRPPTLRSFVHPLPLPPSWIQTFSSALRFFNSRIEFETSEISLSLKQ